MLQLALMTLATTLVVVANNVAHLVVVVVAASILLVMVVGHLFPTTILLTLAPQRWTHCLDANYALSVDTQCIHAIVSLIRHFSHRLHHLPTVPIHWISVMKVSSFLIPVLPTTLMVTFPSCMTMLLIMVTIK